MLRGAGFHPRPAHQAPKHQPHRPLSFQADPPPNQGNLRYWRLHLVSNPLIVHTSDTTFETDVLKSAEPVLLDFWAEWCGPCKMIGPILDDAAREYKGRLKIAKLNIDENPQHAAEVSASVASRR